MLHFRLSPDTELRLLEPKHAEELLALIERNREHLSRWMAWAVEPQSLERVRSGREKSREQSAENGSFEAGLWHRGKLAGVLAVHPIDWRNRRTSLGYWLDEGHQGMGLMTEACRSVLDYLFGVLRLNRVEIRVATSNARSRAIPERLGFRHEGTLRQAGWLHDHFEDDEVYALLLEDWDGRGW